MIRVDDALLDRMADMIGAKGIKGLVEQERLRTIQKF